MDNQLTLSDAMVNKNSSFLGNPTLKKEYEPVALTLEHIEELKKCINDPVYFAENYMKVINIDTGLQTIKLYDYQKEVLHNFKEHRYNIVLSCRQSGKCVTGDSYITVRIKGSNQPIKINIQDFFNMVK